MREMRRRQQAMSSEDAIGVLKEGAYGVLAVSGDENYPYAVPLQYVYEKGKLIFHCALEGHKLDGIKRNEKVSFCVVTKDRVLPAMFATDFCSAIAFGRAKIVTDAGEKQNALHRLVEKYAPEHVEAGHLEIERMFDATCIVAIEVEHVSGKVASHAVQQGGAQQ